MNIDTSFPGATASAANQQQRVHSTAREVDPQLGSSTGRVQQDGATARVSATVAPSRTARAADTADLSGIAPSLSSLTSVVHASADVRQTKVQALQQAVAQRTYQVSPERIAESMLAQATSKLR